MIRRRISPTKRSVVEYLVSFDRIINSKVCSDEDDVPTEVVKFLEYFAQVIEDENVPEIFSCYDQAFPEYTDRSVLSIFLMEMMDSDSSANVCGQMRV